MKRWLSLAVALCCVPALTIACGGDGNSTVNSAGAIASKTAAGTTPAAAATPNPSVSPKLSLPASRYTVLQADVGPAFLTDIPHTFVLDIDSYAATATFATKQEGQKLLKDWGYAGGYETTLIPEGRQGAVLLGGFYLTIESHLFSNEDGAKKAFTYFEQKLKMAGKATVTTIEPVGNQSSGWTLVDGKVTGSTTVDASYHRIVFRRGNLVAVVLTYGAAAFMTIDDAEAFAVLIDQKILGTVDAIEPTATSNYTPPAGAATRAPTNIAGLTPVTALTPSPAAGR